MRLLQLPKCQQVVGNYLRTALAEWTDYKISLSVCQSVRE